MHADANGGAPTAPDPRARWFKRQALRLLARREYSRSELQARLLADARRHPVSAEVPAVAGDADLQRVLRLLDELGLKGLQCDNRTAAVRVQSKAAGWGERRLRADLQQRGLPPELVLQHLQPLRESELARASALWQRRFGAIATTPAEQARQARYLAARGFAADVVRRVVRRQGVPEDETT